MYIAGTSYALWHALQLQYVDQGIPVVPVSCATNNKRAKMLEYSLVVADQVSKAWKEHGATPRRVIRFRAHVNRITSIRLIPGSKYSEYWVITGSVDGFVRVWDLYRAMRHSPSAVDVTDELEEDTLAIHAQEENAVLDDDSVTSVDPETDIRRSSNAFLVAEVDTGGDVASIDAQVDEAARIIKIAVGSYYSSSACLLYELHIDVPPRFMDLRASLDPPEWGGTQCVSLLDDVVAVGAYTGRIHLLDWRTGERCALELTERGSIAALKLLPTHLLAVTRLGIVLVYERHNTIQANLVADHTISQRPILSISFSDFAADTQESRSCSTSTSTSDPGTGPTAHLPLPLAFLCVDPICLTHWQWEHGTWKQCPKQLRCVEIRHERLVGASIGASGRRGLLTSSLGGVPPMCLARAYSKDNVLCVIRPTPEMVVPDAEYASSRYQKLASRVPLSSLVTTQASLTAGLTSPTPPLPSSNWGPGSAPASVPPSAPSSASPSATASAPCPRRVRVDSFSSTSTTSSTVPPPSSRVDMLTESAVDDARGIICLASIRGAVWISDYGGALDTM